MQNQLEKDGDLEYESCSLQRLVTCREHPETTIMENNKVHKNQEIREIKWTQQFYAFKICICKHSQ